MRNNLPLNCTKQRGTLRSIVIRQSFKESFDNRFICTILRRLYCIKNGLIFNKLVQYIECFSCPTSDNSIFVPYLCTLNYRSVINFSIILSIINRYLRTVINVFYLLFLFFMLFLIIKFEINKLICISSVHFSSIVPENSRILP